MRLERAYEFAGWVILAAMLAAEADELLGPRRCRLCRARLTLADRAHGCHVCDIDAGRVYP